MGTSADVRCVNLRCLNILSHKFFSQFRKGNLAVEDETTNNVQKKKKKKSKKKKSSSDEEEVEIIERAVEPIVAKSIANGEVQVEVVPKTTKVQPFFTNHELRPKFTQLSDHYGIESVLKFTL